MVDVLFLIVFFLLVLLVWSVLVNVWAGVPYIASPMSVTKAMVDLAQPKAGETVFDLGAGDGRLLRLTKQTSPQSIAIGYECTPTVFAWGKVCSWLSRPKIDFRFGNLFRQNLTKADVIFVYLFPNVMKRLIPKFERELRPGTRIVSHAFSLPGRNPTKIVKVQTRRMEKTVRLYIW